jgi:hypothetical protein
MKKLVCARMTIDALLCSFKSKDHHLNYRGDYMFLKMVNRVIRDLSIRKVELGFIES